MTQGPVIIVGAGHAGFQLAASLRQHGFAGRIALVNDEGQLPYQRPPLSKAYLKGTGGPDSLMFRPDKFFHDQTIDLIAGHAVSIDRSARKLLLASGASLGYWHLVLASGARNRPTRGSSVRLTRRRWQSTRANTTLRLRARSQACPR